MQERKVKFKSQIKTGNEHVTFLKVLQIGTFTNKLENLKLLIREKKFYGPCKQQLMHKDAKRNEIIKADIISTGGACL